MPRILSQPPCRGLREYVRAFAQRDFDGSTHNVVQPHLAILETIIEFDFCNLPLIEYDSGASVTASRISMIGPYTSRRSCIRFKSPSDSFAIFFQPLGPWQLFRIPIGLLVNQTYRADDVCGDSIGRLWRRMAETTLFTERVSFAEEYLLRAAAEAVCRTPIMNSAVYLFGQRGAQPISTLASQAALSVRQFERRFLEDLGMPPKLFARIARYQGALDARVTSPGRSWLDIAHSFGYHDQMHMIRDFHDLCGLSPSRAIVQLGEMQRRA